MTEVTTPNRIWLIEVVPKYNRWVIVLHYKNANRLPHSLNSYQRKSDAVAEARQIGRDSAQLQGNSVQLHIKKKDGTIPKGSHGTSTYGYDPEGSEG